MHITFVISSLEPGGAERVITGLANHSVAQGHQVSLVTMASPDTPPFYAVDSRIQLIQLNILHLTKQRMLKQLLHRIKLTLKLRVTFKELQPDLIVSFIDLMNLITLVSSWGLRVPIVISERIDPRFRDIPAVYKWLRLKLYPYAKCLIVQTQSVASYFPAAMQPMMTIIPNVVSVPPCERVCIRDQVVNVVCVGRLDRQKDHATLIKAFAVVVKTHPHAKLTIYGKGDHRYYLEGLINQLNLQHHVFLPGTVSPIQDKLSKADLFVFPSLYEGFPNALCEAMAMGLPVIASDCSGSKDVVQDHVNGRQFPAGNLHALIEVMLELMSDYPQRQRLAQAAQSIITDYGPDHIYQLWDKALMAAIKE